MKFPENETRLLAVRWREISTDPSRKKEADAIFSQLMGLLKPTLNLMLCKWRWRNDLDDLRQVAMMGILDALRNYDSSLSFQGYVSTVISRRLITHNRSMQGRCTHGIRFIENGKQVEFVSLDADIDVRGRTRHLKDLLATNDDGGIEAMIEAEDSPVRLLCPDDFSRMEWLAAELVFGLGYSYEETQEILHRDHDITLTMHGVDNATQRFKKKAHKILSGAPRPKQTARPQKTRAKRGEGKCVRFDNNRWFAVVTGQQVGAYPDEQSALEAVRRFKEIAAEEPIAKKALARFRQETGYQNLGKEYQNSQPSKTTSGQNSQEPKYQNSPAFSER